MRNKRLVSVSQELAIKKIVFSSERNLFLSCSHGEKGTKVAKTKTTCLTNRWHRLSLGRNALVVNLIGLIADSDSGVLD